MGRVLAIAVAAAAALAIAGCGGGSSSTGTLPSSDSSVAASSGRSPVRGGGTVQGAVTESPGAGKAGSEGTHSPATAPNANPKRGEGGDASIQGYGSGANGSDVKELEKAAFAFFRAMKTRDFPEVCKDLLKANREELQSYMKAGTCSAVLNQLLSPAVVVEARKALFGTVTEARIKGGSAFLLFRPQGGPLSFIVLKRENGAWHPTSLALGTPLSPTAAGA